MSPEILVHPPQKQSDHYLARITDDKNGKVRIVLNGVSWIHLHPMQDDDHLLRLYLPNDTPTAKAMDEIDVQVLHHTIHKNHEWFQTEMSEETVRAFFRPSRNSGVATPTISVYVSSWKDPLVIWNKEALDSIHDMQEVPKDALVRAEIEAVGVCFFRQKFGIRWLLRKLWIDTSGHEEYTIDRESVESAWDQELEDFQQTIVQDKRALERRMHELDIFYESLQSCLRDAKESKSMKDWNAKLESLSRTLAKYRSGAVTSLL